MMGRKERYYRYKIRIRSHSMFMLALVITTIIVDTLFRLHLTIMSSTIYMYISVHKKNPKIERTEGEW
jgi:hypothetical protein